MTFLRNISLFLYCYNAFAQCVPIAINPIQSPLRAHVGFPLDYTVLLNRWCTGRVVLFEKVSGPPEFTIDGAGGLIYYTPTNAGTFSVTVKATEYFVYPNQPAGSDTETFTIIVDRNSLTYPLFRDYRNEPGEISVTGLAPDCISWQLFWSYKATPSTRYAISSIQPPVSLFSVPWNVTAIPDGGQTILTIQTILPDGTTNDLVNPVIIDRTIKWSRRIAPITHSVVAANIVGDVKDELLVGDHFGSVTCFDHLGNQLWKTQNYGVAYSGVSVSGSRTAFATSAKLYLLNNSGGTVTGFPKTAISNTEFRSTPSVADLDGDGVDEILAGFRGKTTSTLGGFSVYSQSGTLRFTKRFDHWANYASPSVAQLDGVGRPEIIASSYNKVYIYSSTGTMLRSATLTRPSTSAVVNGSGSFIASSKPSIGGGLIVIGANVFDYNLAPLWTATNATPSLSAALADLDLDGSLEVILGGFTYRSNGMPFPRATVPGLSSSAVGSCNGTHLTTMSGSRLTYFRNSGGWTKGLTGYEIDGSVEPGYPKSLFGETGDVGSPHIGDFDKDGLVDIAAAITDSNYGGVVVVYRMPGAYDSLLMPWPMFGHDAKQSGDLLQ